MTDLSEAIRVLELEQVSLGEVEVKDVEPDDDVAEGFVADEQFEVRQFVLENEALDLEITAAEQMGFRLHHYHEHSDLIRIWPPKDIRLQVIDGDRDDGGVYELEDDEIFVDFSRRDEPVALVTPECEGLVLSMDNSDLKVGQLLQIPVSESLDDFAPPVEQWLEESEDEWLVEEIRRRLDSGDPWEKLVGPGHLYRLEEIDETRRDEDVERLLEGEIIEEQQRILRRVDDEMSDQAASLLGARAMSVIENLIDELEDLRRAYEFGEPMDADTIAPVLELRDDVQSAWLLLRGRDEIREMLEGPLEAADDIGRRLVDDCRLEDIVVDSTQLRRASLSDATAWWVQLAWSDDDLEERLFDDEV